MFAALKTMLRHVFCAWCIVALALMCLAHAEPLHAEAVPSTMTGHNLHPAAPDQSGDQRPGHGQDHAKSGCCSLILVEQASFTAATFPVSRSFTPKTLGSLTRVPDLRPPKSLETVPSA